MLATCHIPKMYLSPQKYSIYNPNSHVARPCPISQPTNFTFWLCSGILLMGQYNKVLQKLSPHPEWFLCVSSSQAIHFLGPLIHIQVHVHVHKRPNNHYWIMASQLFSVIVISKEKWTNPRIKIHWNIFNRHSVTIRMCSSKEIFSNQLFPYLPASWSNQRVDHKQNNRVTNCTVLSDNVGNPHPGIRNIQWRYI